MDNRVYFFRDVKDIEELKQKTSTAIANGERPQKYFVRATVELSIEAFDDFTEHFIKTHNFITPHRAYLDMNTKYEYICLCATAGNRNYDILINTSGHSYARTVALKMKI